MRITVRAERQATVRFQETVHIHITCPTTIAGLKDAVCAQRQDWKPSIRLILICNGVVLTRDSQLPAALDFLSASAEHFLVAVADPSQEGFTLKYKHRTQTGSISVRPSETVGQAADKIAVRSPIFSGRLPLSVRPLLCLSLAKLSL